MGRHGEAMRLVAHHLQQLQRGIVAIEADRFLAIGNVNLFLAFCETSDGDAFDAEAIQRRQRGIQLPSAAIDEDHVR